MKSLILIMLSLCLSTIAEAQVCPSMPQFDVYQMKQVILTFGTDFNVTSQDGSPAGKVIQKLFNWGKTFELRNADNQLVAKANQRVFSLGVKIDIYDCNGTFIGSLQEDILKSLLKVTTTYSILDANNQLVGQSKKLDFFSTDITFFNERSENIAEAHRPWVNFLGDTWSIQVHNNTTLDSRLIFFAPSFKTSKDGESSND